MQKATEVQVTFFFKKTPNKHKYKKCVLEIKMPFSTPLMGT